MSHGACLESPLSVDDETVFGMTGILGYADDAIIVTAVLRSVVRRAGIDAVRAHWPGTDDGFTALARLTGITGPTTTQIDDADRATLGDRGPVDGLGDRGPLRRWPPSVRRR